MRRPDGQKERNFGPRFRRRKAGSKTPAQFLTKRTEHSALGVIAEWWGAPTNVCEIGALFHVNLLGLSAKTSDSSCSAGVLDIYIAFSFQTQRNWFMLNTHTHTLRKKRKEAKQTKSKIEEERMTGNAGVIWKAILKIFIPLNRKGRWGGNQEATPSWIEKGHPGLSGTEVGPGGKS